MQVRFFALTAPVLTAGLLTACATTYVAVPDPIPVIGEPREAEQADRRHLTVQLTSNHEHTKS